MPVLQLNELKDLVLKVFLASKVSPENAEIVTEALVAAEADGLASHGTQRVTYYADQAISGTVNGMVVPEMTQPADAVVRSQRLVWRRLVSVIHITAASSAIMSKRSRKRVW